MNKIGNFKQWAKRLWQRNSRPTIAVLPNQRSEWNSILKFELLKMLGNRTLRINTIQRNKSIIKRCHNLVLWLYICVSVCVCESFDGAKEADAHSNA